MVEASPDGRRLPPMVEVRGAIATNLETTLTDAGTTPPPIADAFPDGRGERSASDEPRDGENVGRA